MRLLGLWYTEMKEYVQHSLYKATTRKYKQMWVFQTKIYTSLIYTLCINRFNMKSYITNSTTIQFITIDNRLKRVHTFELHKCLNRVYVACLIVYTISKSFTCI